MEITDPNHPLSLLLRPFELPIRITLAFFLLIGITVLALRTADWLNVQTYIADDEEEEEYSESLKIDIFEDVDDWRENS